MHEKRANTCAKFVMKIAANTKSSENNHTLIVKKIENEQLHALPIV